MVELKQKLHRKKVQQRSTENGAAGGGQTAERATEHALLGAARPNCWAGKSISFSDELYIGRGLKESIQKY